MKKSFILHNDSLIVVNELTTEQKGELFQAIVDYHSGKEVQLSGLMKVVFIPFKNQFERDAEKYENIRNRNTDNVKERWSKVNTKNTSRKPRIPKIPKRTKNTDSDSDSVSVNDSDNVNANEKEKLKAEITKSLSGNGRTPEEVEQVASEQVAEYEKDFQSLTTWIKTNTPRVAQMKEPFTLLQFAHLRHKIPDKQKIRDLLLSMHNWKDLQTKNVSAYLTILKWSKNDT